MPLTMAHALVIVGLNEGKSLQELADIAGISNSNLSRYILSLTDRTRTGGVGSGYGLMVREQDPLNLRKNNYYLSPAGRLVLEEISECLQCCEHGPGVIG
jgi:DNA-binding MarR family transcriptional regulator